MVVLGYTLPPPRDAETVCSVGYLPRNQAQRAPRKGIFAQRRVTNGYRATDSNLVKSTTSGEPGGWRDENGRFWDVWQNWLVSILLPHILRLRGVRGPRGEVGRETVIDPDAFFAALIWGRSRL